MSPVKESMIEIIGRRPDDSTDDEILRELTATSSGRTFDSKRASAL